MSSGDFVDGEGLINPDRWPLRAGKLGRAWVAEMAEEAERIAREVAEATSGVQAAWSHLDQAYRSDEAHVVHAAMVPIKTGGDDEAERWRSAARKMRDYESETLILDNGLRAAEEAAWQLRSDAATLERSWFEVVTDWMNLTDPLEGPLRRRHDDLVRDVERITNRCLEEIQQLATGLQNLERVKGMPGLPGGGPGSYGGVVGGPVDHGFPPGREFIQDASADELVEWWDGLEPWQREVAPHTLAGMGLSDEVLGEKTSEAMQDVTSSGGGVDEVAALDVLVQMFGDDDAVMGHAFTLMGAAGTVSALSGLGQSTSQNGADTRNAAAARRAASGLRESLSSVSEGWTRGEAESFLENLTGPDIEKSGATIGFLFADHDGHRMGEQLTVEMATRIDAWERSEGALNWPKLGDRDAFVGMHQIAQRAGEGSHSGRIADPMARVLSTLGEYPDAALGWLSDGGDDRYETDSKVGAARLTYYYEMRDSSLDGFEGVGALWSGAQRASGGPYDTASYLGSDYAHDTWERVATVNTVAARGLEANTAFVPERLSPLGSIEFADVALQALPQLIEYPIAGYDSKIAALADVSIDWPRDENGQPAPGARPIANMSRDALAVLVSGATATPDSAGYFADGVGRFQDGLVVAAHRDGVDDPADVIERAAELQGLVDGARDGAHAAGAGREDAVIARAINRKYDAYAAIPIPAPDGWKETVASGASLLLGEALDYGRERELAQWTTHYADAQEEIAGDTGERVDAMRHTARSLARDLGVTDLDLADIEGDYDWVYKATRRTGSLRKGFE